MPTPREPSDLRRRFTRLTALNIATNLTVPLAGLVDTALLGHLEEIRFLAGVALAAVLFEYVYWTFGFLRMATTGLTAQAMGRGETRETYLTLYRALAVALAAGICLLALRHLLAEVGFALLSGAPEVESAGREYFEARIWAAPATLCNFAFLGWFLGRERSDLALWMTVVANLANILFDWLFIVRLGLAAWGAGLGTTLSQYLMLATAVGLFLKQGPRPPWTWSEVLDRTALGSLAKLNRDILIRTVSLVTTFALFVNFSSLLGIGVLAANAVLQRFVMVVAYLVDGAAFATESLAGLLRGRGDRSGLAALRRLALVSGLALAVPFALAFALLPGPFVRLLTSHGPTVEMAVGYAPWLAPALLLGSAAYIFDGYFLGLTQGRALRNTMLLSTFGVFLPMAFLALRLGSNTWLWAAFATFMGARTALLWLASGRLDGV